LLQYWGKLPDTRHCKTHAVKKSVYLVQTRINDLVKSIESLSNDLKLEDF